MLRQLAVFFASSALLVDYSEKPYFTKQRKFRELVASKEIFTSRTSWAW
jgi:hypothetical protein